MLDFFLVYFAIALVAAPILWLCVYFIYRGHPDPQDLLAAAIVWPVPVVLLIITLTRALSALIVTPFKRRK